MAIKLGEEVREVVTGFEGVVTGRAEYLSGCHQLLVAPKVKADGAYAEGHWFDEQRLVVKVGSVPIVLDNSQTPGCDTPAPRR